MGNNGKYCILRWNKKHGDEASFIVQENETGKQALFTVGRTSDVAWVREDLVKQHSDWEDFEKEPVDNLGDIII